MAPEAQHSRQWAGRPGSSATRVLLILALAGSAYLLAVAIGTPRYTWLAWLTLLPLLIAVRKLCPLGATGAGALWGACVYLFSATGANDTLTLGALCLALLTGVPALYACLCAWLTRRFGFSPLVLGLGWVGAELALKPLGLSNGLIAGAPGEGTLIQWVGGVFGYVLVAFLIVFTCASLLAFLNGLRIRIPQPEPVLSPPIPTGRLEPQRVSCLSLWAAFMPSQPRAPPLFG